MRDDGLRKLLENQQVERELEKISLESRKTGLSFNIARGAGLRGMDLSGLSDPFCVVLWNGDEVIIQRCPGLHGGGDM